MKYCVLAQLAFTSAARRDAVLADLQQRISTRPRWGIDVLRADTVYLGPNKTPNANGIVAELRFDARADQEDLKSRLEGFATGQRQPVAGSYIALHDCNHDEATPVTCVEVTRGTW